MSGQTKKVWEQLSTIQKRVTIIMLLLTGLTAMGGLAWAGFEGIDSLATETEAAAYATTGDIAVMKRLDSHIRQNTESNNRSEVLRLRREIRRLEAEEGQEGLSHAKKTQIKNDIKYYGDLIECIRGGKELCY
jgi:flagellar basal body-associated protein FliL